MTFSVQILPNVRGHSVVWVLECLRSYNSAPTPHAPGQYSGLKSLPSLQQYCHLSSANYLSGAHFWWELHEGKNKSLLFAKTKQLDLLTAGED